MECTDDTPPRRAVDGPTGIAIDPDLFAELTAMLYQELRSVARRERYRVRAGSTLCTTALVNEAWLKLRSTRGWNDEQHFMRTAALAMRHVLVNDAVSRQAEKRNFGQPMVALDQLVEPIEARASDEPDLLALEDALRQLETLSPRQAQIVECRYFAGYTEEETARALGVTDRTVRRDWVKARAWLYRQMHDGNG